MSKVHLPRIAYHQVYNIYSDKKGVPHKGGPRVVAEVFGKALFEGYILAAYVHPICIVHEPTHIYFTFLSQYTTRVSGLKTGYRVSGLERGLPHKGEPRVVAEVFGKGSPRGPYSSNVCTSFCVHMPPAYVHPFSHRAYTYVFYIPSSVHNQEFGVKRGVPGFGVEKRGTA